MPDIRCPSARFAHPKYVPIVFRIPIARDATPNEVAASCAFPANKLEEPAFKKATAPDPTITGKSIYTLRRLKILSAFLCIMARPFAFSPVWAKYSSKTIVQLTFCPTSVAPESPMFDF